MNLPSSNLICPNHFMKNYIKKNFKIIDLFLKRKKIKKVKKLGTYTYQKIVSDLSNLGIKNGDSVFVHSSLSKLGFIEGGSETIINALKHQVGTEGTLIFPTFSFPGGGLLSTISDENYIFDVENEPSSVGIISEVFRKQKNVVRSIHPTHSIAAFGKHANDIVKNHIDLGSNFGKGTPFGKMLDLNVKMIGLGVRIPMFTFFHCVEDYNPDYFKGLYHKSTIPVKIKKGDNISIYETAYHDPLFVKDRIERNELIEKYFTDYFLDSNKLKTGKVGNANAIVIESQDFYSLTLELAKNDKTIYKI